MFGVFKMALRLYLGRSGSGKSHKLYEYIIEESLSHPEMTYLILVPEQYNLSTQQQLISMHPKKGILNIDVLSFTRLAHRVFEEVGYSRARGATIDDIGKNLILMHMASGNEDKLTALSGIFNKIGYISEVKSVISEFMQYGIGDKELDSLIKMSEGRGTLHAKLTDIRYLYGEFLKYINGKYITTEEILQKVRDAVPASGKLKKSVIVLDGYTGFTPVQLSLIGALMENCVDVYITLLLDETASGDEGEESIFHMSYKTIKALDKLCKEGNIKREADVIVGRDSIPARFLYDPSGNILDKDMQSRELIFLEKNLFRAGESTYADGSSADSGGIRIFTGKNPEEEAVEAAVRIERLVREKGYRYKDIAVVSGDTGTYMNACSRAFAKYDIPYFIDKTVPVLLNPMIEYIRSLFDIVINDFGYESMFRYMRSDVCGFDAEDTDRLDNYVLKYGIRGRKQWSRDFVKKPSGMEADMLARINELRRRAVDEINLFIDEIGDSGSDSDGSPGYDVKIISTALYHSIVRMDLEKKIRNMSGYFEEQGDLVRASEYGRIYEEVCELLDKIVRLLPGEIISLKEYAELLDAGFAEIRTGVLPGTDDYIQIGDITRTRLRDIKALFFMGVNDGIIPSGAGSGGIISDMEREFLTDNENGIEMAPTARTLAYTQRLYLYMLVTKPSEYLYISYSGLDSDGKSLNPSYFVKTLRRLFPHLQADHPDDSIENRVYSIRSGFDMLAASVGQMHKTDKDSIKNDCISLFKVYSANEEYRKKTALLLDGAFSRGVFERKDEISRAVADVLYGRELTCSITRLETYARCAYSHFLKYGLSLKERELFSFEAKDLGSVFHDVLKYYAQILDERKLSWFDVSASDREAITEEAIERCIGSEDYGALYGAFRTRYMINRMRRITRRTVDTLTEQLKRGSFIPHDFEFAFSKAVDMDSIGVALSDEEKIRIIGRIDRVDVCEKDDKIYVKVIDYKSGNKSFDLAAVYKGLDLQLVVYMNAALEHISKVSGSETEVIPAGILYYHIDDPVIRPEGPVTDEEIEREIMKQLKMKGLVNCDGEIYRLMDNDLTDRSAIIPVTVKKDGSFGAGSSVAGKEEFKILSDYVNYKIAGMGHEIIDGNISIEPHKKNDGEVSPCAYCDYSGICGYRGEGSVEDGPDEYQQENDAEDEGGQNASDPDTIRAMKIKLETGL